MSEYMTSDGMLNLDPDNVPDSTTYIEWYIELDDLIELMSTGEAPEVLKATMVEYLSFWQHDGWRMVVQEGHVFTRAPDTDAYIVAVRKKKDV